MNNTPTTTTAPTNTTEKETTMDTTREIIDTYTDKITDAQVEAAKQLRDFHERFMTTQPNQQEIEEASNIRDCIILNHESNVKTMILEMEWLLAQDGLSEAACTEAGLRLAKFAAL